MTRPGLLRHLLAAVTAAAMVSGCTVAQPDSEAYRERTQLVVTDAIGHVATAQLTLEQARDDRILRRYALSTVRSSDATLNTAVGAFLELYPPEEADGRFARTNRLLGEATDLVTEARIALYRDDRADFAPLVEELSALIDDLEKLERELS